MHTDYILKVENVTKRFPGVLALDGVSLAVRPGTVHAVMGENGAGKSTLMKILFGIYSPDSGEFWFKGEHRRCESPHDALKSGIAMIHQELSGVRQLSIAQNVFLGKEITYPRTGLLNMGEMIRQTARLMESLHINIDPRRKMGDLSVSQQQLCELVKAVSYKADLIIMDEPTSAMTESEVKHLFSIIGELTAKGIAIIYITHKMDEVFQIANEVSIYRDGKFVGNSDIASLDIPTLVNMMVGRSIQQMFPKEQVPIGDELLRVENLSCEPYFKNVSFTLRRGEILGFAGLVGAGRSEVMETLFGIRRKTSGDIYISGKEVRIDNPRQAIQNRIAMLTEDRKFNGCILPLDVADNTVIASLGKYCMGPFLSRTRINASSGGMRDKLNIKTPSLRQKIVNLSGGNQQKVLVGRWLLTEPEILIFDEPTRGIDVGSKSEIHKILTQLAGQGKGIIIISSEMPEVMGMSDRIVVMHEGRITGTLDAADATQEHILLYASADPATNTTTARMLAERRKRNEG